MDPVLDEECLEGIELAVAGLVIIEADGLPLLDGGLKFLFIHVSPAVAFERDAFGHNSADEFGQDGPGDGTADVDLACKMVGHERLLSLAL